MCHHDCVGDELGRVEVNDAVGKPSRRGGDRTDGVGDCDTLEQRIGEHGRRLPHEDAVGRRCKDPRCPGLAAASRRALQRGPSADQIIEDDHRAVAYLADEELAGDDPAAAPLLAERRRLFTQVRREGSAELLDPLGAADVRRSDANFSLPKQASQVLHKEWQGLEIGPRTGERVFEGRQIVDVEGNRRAPPQAAIRGATYELVLVTGSRSCVRRSLQAWQRYEPPP